MLLDGISKKLTYVKNYFSKSNKEEVKFDFDEAVNMLRSE